MAKLSVVPKVVDLEGYGGDTLPVVIIAPTEFIAGREFTAQVRSRRGAPVDATFVVIPPTGVDEPCNLYLSAVDTARLANEAPVSTRLTGDEQGYLGVWDCQLAPADGGDPTNTLAYGTVTIITDVTRTTP